MRKFLTILTLALSPLAGSPAIASPVTAAPNKPLDQLVGLLLSEDSLVRLGGRAFDATLDQEIGKNPQARAFARDPGLKVHVAAKVRPAFLRILKKEIPSLRTQIRTIAGEGLTESEVRDALTFFASPTGEKLRAQVYETIGSNPGKTQEQLQGEAMAAVMARMKPGDYPALIAFGASSAASKMKTLNPRIAAASQAWSDRIIAKHGKRLRALAAKATSRYLKGKK